VPTENVDSQMYMGHGSADLTCLNGSEHSVMRIETIRHT
jgi:hypothetical protein